MKYTLCLSNLFRGYPGITIKHGITSDYQITVIPSF